MTFAVTKSPEMAVFALYYGARSYKEPKKAIADIDISSKPFCIISKVKLFVSSWFLHVQVNMDCDLLIGTNALVRNMENKIYTLVEHLSNLTKSLKMRHKASSYHVQEKATETIGPIEKTCFCC